MSEQIREQNLELEIDHLAIALYQKLNKESFDNAGRFAKDEYIRVARIIIKDLGYRPPAELKLIGDDKIDEAFTYDEEKFKKAFPNPLDATREQMEALAEAVITGCRNVAQAQLSADQQAQQG